MSDLEVLKEIEKIIGKELKPCPDNMGIMDWGAKCTYILNENERIVGLNLRDCNLRNIVFLKSLTQLTQLNLYLNKLDNLTDLANNLIELTQLHLGSNNLRNIEPLENLNKLTLLSLYDNNLQDIKSLYRLVQIEKLNLSGNYLKNIEMIRTLNKLKFLNLSFNKIKILPEWLLNFDLPIKWDSSYDNGIYLGGNPLESPPPEIIEQSNDAIRAYFEQLKREGTDYIYEAKLILVGEGGAGKTSLANKIINPDYELVPEPDSKPTQGIDIFPYLFTYKDKPFKVNIWDFAGQELKHQTHQFFLTKRSLYFFVVDSRRDNPNLDYWFKLVELLSDNSPLLIIKNEKQNCLCEIQENQLKAEFTNIKDSLATNLSDNRGLNIIIESLKHFITQLPHIGSPLPKTWVKVRQQLEQDPRHYIDLKEYFELCQSNGFEKEADKLQLSGYLHDLGVCLHFQEDEESPLYKTIILKPTWATDAVYKVLDNADVIKHNGRFNKNDLKHIWQDAQYNAMRGELLALMQKFKLCYEIPNQPQHYIAPQLLEQNPPYYTWQADNNLLLRYQYDFMPKGIISQFIVIMHQYIAYNYQSVWKTGVVLEKDNTQAEIIEYYKDRQIHIRVSGENKKQLLTIVSHELDKINKSYPRLEAKCDKLTPCKCTECQNLITPYFHQYKVLMKLKQKTTQAQCQKSGDMVNILDLIDDITLTGLSEAKDNPQFNFENCIFTDSVFKPEENNMGGDTTNTNISIGGNVTNSTISGRDSNIQTQQGMSKDELLTLLTQFKELLQKAKLNEDTVEVIHEDINNVEKQLNKLEPNKSIVSNKLESINGLLEDANNTMDTAEKANETFGRLMGVWGNIYPVVSNLSGLLP